MTSTGLILVSYILAVSTIAGLIIWAGRIKGVRWSAAEYLLLYLPFLMVLGYVVPTFGDMDAAVVEMGLAPPAVAAIAALGGMVAACSLLPRLWVPEKEVGRMVLSAAASFVVGLFCLKMFFLAVVMGNPHALVRGDPLDAAEWSHADGGGGEEEDAGKDE